MVAEQEGRMMDHVGMVPVVNTDWALQIEFPFEEAGRQSDTQTHGKEKEKKDSM